MRRWTVIWYGPDRARHAEKIDAVNSLTAKLAVFKLHPEAQGVYTV